MFKITVDTIMIIAITVLFPIKELREKTLIF